MPKKLLMKLKIRAKYINNWKNKKELKLMRKKKSKMKLQFSIFQDF